MYMIGGDLAPITEIQAILAVTIALCGQIFIAIIFANMGYIIDASSKNNLEYEKAANDLSNQMKKNKLDQHLKEKIFDYFEFCWKQNVIFKEKFRNLKELSSSL